MSSLMVYSSVDEQTRLNLRAGGNSIWLSQLGIAEPFCICGKLDKSSPDNQVLLIAPILDKGGWTMCEAKFLCRMNMQMGSSEV